MDDGGATLLCLQYEAKGDGVRLGHVRAHDQYAVGIGEIPLRHGGRAAPIGSVEDGHRIGVAVAGLILDPHHAEARTDNLLDEVVFFVVESGAAQRGTAVRMVDRSEEQTTELQSPMRISYDVFCLQKKTNTNK